MVLFFYVGSSPELLSLTSVGKDYVATATVLGRTALPIFDGGREAKNILSVQFEGEVEPTFLIERTRCPNSVRTWARFHTSNITVAPDIYVSDYDKLMVPDLKADGSEVYGKYLAALLLDRRERELERPQIDELFVGLLEPKERQINDKVAQCARTASEERLKLPFDDPLELIIHPDGSWDLIVLDFTFAEVMPTDNASSLEASNDTYVSSFLVNLDRIYKKWSHGAYAAGPPNAHYGHDLDTLQHSSTLFVS